MSTNLKKYLAAIDGLRIARHQEIELRHELDLVKTRIELMRDDIDQDERHRAMHKIKHLTDRLCAAQRAVADFEAKVDIYSG